LESRQSGNCRLSAANPNYLTCFVKMVSRQTKRSPSPV